MLALLAAVGFVRADDVQIRGNMHSTTFSADGRFLSTNSYSYSVKRTSEAWNIKVTNAFTAKLYPKAPPYREIAFDGRDMFSIVRAVSDNGSTTTQTNSASNSLIIGTVHEAQFPISRDFVTMSVWMLYASEAYWQNVRTNDLPSFLPRPRTGERLVFEIQTNQLPPFLPQAVSLTSKYPGLTSRRSEQEGLNALGGPFIRAQFRVYEWEALEGKKYPSRFNISVFDNPLRPEAKRAQSLIMTLSNSWIELSPTKAELPAAVRPVGVGQFSVTDRRFQKTAGPLVYTNAGTRWLAREDPALKRDIADITAGMEKVRASSRTRKFISSTVTYLWCAGCATLVLLWVLEINKSKKVHHYES